MKNEASDIKKKRIIIISVLSIAGVGLITALIFTYFLSWHTLPIFTGSRADAAESTSAAALTATVYPTQTPTPSASPTPEPTPAPATPTPLPTATPHPGDREGKFLPGDIYVDDTTYRSEDLSIEITKTQTELITYYVAEVYYRNNENYYSAFSYGVDDDKIQITSEILKDTGGVLAVSGDYYNARDYGLIIRNSVLYRKHSSTEILAVFNDGSMKTYPIKGISAEELLSGGALHTYSFGPALLENGGAVESYEGRTREYLRKLQPRCAVGMIEPYHYVFVVVDGRAPGYSQGVTMEELSKIIYDLGCIEAYNLDGGGSATMVFMDKLVNRPQGREYERKIADAIVFKEIN